MLPGGGHALVEENKHQHPKPDDQARDQAQQLLHVPDDLQRRQHRLSHPPHIRGEDYRAKDWGQPHRPGEEAVLCREVGEDVDECDWELRKNAFYLKFSYVCPGPVLCK